MQTGEGGEGVAVDLTFKRAIKPKESKGNNEIGEVGGFRGTYGWGKESSSLLHNLERNELLRGTKVYGKRNSRAL